MSLPGACPSLAGGRRPEAPVLTARDCLPHPVIGQHEPITWPGREIVADDLSL
jgi:hypothetical protein